MAQQKKARRVGRPRLPKGEAKGRIVPIRFTHDDLELMEVAARASNQTVSRWVRNTVHAILVEMKTRKLTLLCCECSAVLNSSQVFEFGGTVACEKCVRNYYRDRPSEVEQELQTRRSNAIRWMQRNRRALEKAARRFKDGSN